MLRLPRRKNPFFLLFPEYKSLQKTVGMSPAFLPPGALAELIERKQNMKDRKSILWLLGELPILERDGLLDAESREKLEQFYRKRLDAAPARSWLLRSISIIGVLMISGGIVLLRACVTVQPGRQQSQFEWNVWDTCHQFFYSSAAAFLLFSPERTPPMGVRCFSFFPDGQGIGGGFLGRLEFLHDVGTAAGVAKLCTHRGNCTRIFSLSHAMDHSRFLRRLPV